MRGLIYDRVAQACKDAVARGLPCCKATVIVDDGEAADPATYDQAEAAWRHECRTCPCKHDRQREPKLRPRLTPAGNVVPGQRVLEYACVDLSADVR